MTKIRIVKYGVMYHVYSRIQNNQGFMDSPQARELMLMVLEMAQNKYNFELNNYNVLKDHFHFLITPIEGEASISRIMQFIKSQFARRYNKMMDRMGPVWNERFGDVIVEDTEDPELYFKRIMLYIFYNSVKKGYVKDPRNYKFSCMGFYLDEKYAPRVKLTFSKHFLEFGRNFKERVEKLLVYEKLYIENPSTDFSLT